MRPLGGPTETQPLRPTDARLENKGIRIPLADAKEVFLEARLPAYASKTRKA